MTYELVYLIKKFKGNNRLNHKKIISNPWHGLVVPKILVPSQLIFVTYFVHIIFEGPRSSNVVIRMMRSD